MSYKIALNFKDGATRFIDCKPGEKVLDAAYRNKINLPMDCSDGVCGTCKCRAESGVYDLGDEYIEDALTEDEAEEGLVLTCQMTVTSDCVLSIPVASSVAKVQAVDIPVVVAGVEQLSANRIILSVNGTLPHFIAGQYVNIAVPGHAGVTRSYSMSNLPGADTGTFVIRNVEGGAMSGYLTGAAKAGDKLTLKGPLGSFYLRATQRPMLFVAGGTGIAPILSMLEVLAAEGSDGHPVTLVYSVHEKADLVCMERIEALTAIIPDFTVITTCSGPDQGHERTGRANEHIVDAHLNGGDVDIYLCGPPEMVETVRHHIDMMGVKPTGFHYEKFIPAQPEAVAA